jgi:hypothetical protein
MKRQDIAADVGVSCIGGFFIINRENTCHE